MGWTLPADDGLLPAPHSPLAQPLRLPWKDGSRTLGNRFAVQPMEGWDGEPDGRPSDLTRRRWRHFGRSGAKLIWGGEAVAVLPEARANPLQLMLNPATAPSIAALRDELVTVHREQTGDTGGLVVGVQLTHSGRFSRPYDKKRLEPVIAYNHPWLNRKYPACVEVEPLTDAGVERIIAAYAEAARLAAEIGFDFVDLKHCHGYLGHEFLSARTRKGRFGGSFENRTRFLRELVAAVRAAAPSIEIGVRFSAFDFIPFEPDPETGIGRPMLPPHGESYPYGFGTDAQSPCQPDLTEAKQFLALLSQLGIRMANITGGSPYYVPHIQRPATFPPSDGYLPPEDPLIGAARLLHVARELKQAQPEMIVVSTGWSYLQDYLPHFAQALVREGWTDCVGLGRVMLSYPELPIDVLRHGRMERKRICRTFSDCTTAPRNGMVSGCYPLDAFYKARPESEQLKQVKAAARAVPAS